MKAEGRSVVCEEVRELSQDKIPGLRVPRPSFSPLDIYETEKVLGRKIPEWEKGWAEYLKEIGR
jgi:dTDP-4-dehydrorhamnose reductase